MNGEGIPTEQSMNDNSYAIKTDIKFDPPMTPLRSVLTADEYNKLPLGVREVPHWFRHKKYLMPYALKMNDGELTGELPLCNEWTKFNTSIKKNYPIQSFFRETAYDFLHFQFYKMRERYWSIKHTIFPRQRWLTKQISSDWQDKRTLIVDVLYMMVVHYIEQEKVFDNIVLDDTDEHIKFSQELIECYKWIKHGRKELEIRIDKELTSASESKKSEYHEKYGELNKLEAQLEETDTEFCNWIVNNRQLMWT